MNSEQFRTLLEELDGNSLQTLFEKNARYSPGDDSLHNFHAGGEVLGGTSAQACWGYLTKHLVALRDMVQRDDFSNREDFLEKCQDSINYIRFLWCIGNEARSKQKVATILEVSKEPEAYICSMCGRQFDERLYENHCTFIHALVLHAMRYHSNLVKEEDMPEDVIDKVYTRVYVKETK